MGRDQGWVAARRNATQPAGEMVAQPERKSGRFSIDSRSRGGATRARWAICWVCRTTQHGLASKQGTLQPRTGGSVLTCVDPASPPTAGRLGLAPPDLDADTDCLAGLVLSEGGTAHRCREGHHRIGCGLRNYPAWDSHDLFRSMPVICACRRKKGTTAESPPPPCGIRMDAGSGGRRRTRS
jgi:hypothetical protein